MLRVGLTGGIASGKTHVLRRLAAKGVRTLDLDEVAHEVTSPGGSAYAEVVAAFGSRVLAAGGALDRKALGAIVFSDAEARARLNAIVHPRVREEEARRSGASGEPDEVFVTDGSLLVEAGVHLRFDRLVVVHCDPDEQLRRLTARDPIPEAAARARLEAQMPVSEKRRFAHFEVDTTGSPLVTHRTADALVETLRVVASSTPRRVGFPRDRGLACLQQGPSSGPRGLSPLRLLAEIVSVGGLEMDRATRLVEPSCAGPWYRCARDREGPPGPERLAAPLVLWTLARGGPDPDFLVSAAASVARLTHRDPSSIAAGCFFSLALLDLVVGATVRVAEWRRLTERWAGAAPPNWLEAVVSEPGPQEPDLRRAVRGLTRGGSTPDAGLEWLVDRLGALGR